VTSGSADEVKVLQEKLKQAELKSAEHRNQVSSLKNELKVMQKVSCLLIGMVVIFCRSQWQWEQRPEIPA